MERIFSREFIRGPIFLGSDIDGVLADSHIPGVLKFNQLLKTNYRPEQVTTYDQIKVWATEHGKTPDEAYAINRTIWDDPEVLSESPVIEGATELLAYLYRRGLKPPIITTRIGPLRKPTVDWVKLSFPFIDEEKIFIGKHTDIRDGLAFKIDTVRKQGISWFIEDHPGTAEAVLTETPANILMVRHRFNMSHQFSEKFDGRIYWIQGDSIEVPTLRPILDVLKQIYL